ncbi:Chaperone DnaJ-like protein [Rhynchospora pubera]|uniref:Chaperone DnaJ-like protein n=1 Tax=Rhynchospora pubera TaxID=906938 RepID=A0AAV8GTE2_9POAL|nr:Chaperone DnaJ-like protein [Rhynchospora pubera]
MCTVSIGTDRSIMGRTAPTLFRAWTWNGPSHYEPIRQNTTPHTSLSLYDVLGIKKGATYPEIKAAYRRLVRECHPDTVGDDQKAEFADEFMRVHAAYTTLSDPNKRAGYDRDMMVAIGGRSRLAPSRRSCRAWETDQCW